MMCAGKSVDPKHVGRVSRYTSVGCYPVICLVETRNQFNHDEGVWCPDCANEAAWAIPAEESCPDTLTLTAVDVHWEGSPLECDVCGEEIESAYGDPNEESENDDV